MEVINPFTHKYILPNSKTYNRLSKLGILFHDEVNPFRFVPKLDLPALMKEKRLSKRKREDGAEGLLDEYLKQIPRNVIYDIILSNGVIIDRYSRDLYMNKASEKINTIVDILQTLMDSSNRITYINLFYTYVNGVHTQMHPQGVQEVKYTLYIRKFMEPDVSFKIGLERSLKVNNSNKMLQPIVHTFHTEHRCSNLQDATDTLREYVTKFMCNLRNIEHLEYYLAVQQKDDDDESEMIEAPSSDFEDRSEDEDEEEEEEVWPSDKIDILNNVFGKEFVENIKWMFHKPSNDLFRWRRVNVGEYKE